MPSRPAPIMVSVPGSGITVCAPNWKFATWANCAPDRPARPRVARCQIVKVGDQLCCCTQAAEPEQGNSGARIDAKLVIRPRALIACGAEGRRHGGKRRALLDRSQDHTNKTRVIGSERDHCRTSPASRSSIPKIVSPLLEPRTTVPESAPRLCCHVNESVSIILPAGFGRKPQLVDRKGRFRLCVTSFYTLSWMSGGSVSAEIGA